MYVAGHHSDVGALASSQGYYTLDAPSLLACTVHLLTLVTSWGSRKHQSGLHLTHSADIGNHVCLECAANPTMDQAGPQAKFDLKIKLGPLRI